MIRYFIKSEEEKRKEFRKGSTMQINRMFEIVYLLLDKKNVTAKELAEHFEVSVRTIYRDVENLSISGIPIYTAKGRGGGLRLMEQFILNRTVLSEDEKQEILWALQGFEAVRAGGGADIQKRICTLLGAGEEEWIRVDFSGWSEERQNLFLMVKEAILSKRLLHMVYFNSSGEQKERTIEPYRLSFKDKTWYLYAYCRHAEGFRLFRLSRMKRVTLDSQNFVKRAPEPVQTAQSRDDFCPMADILLWINPSCAYRVYDDFEERDIQVQKDGSFHVRLVCPESDWVYDYILSYAEKARVLSPIEVQMILKNKIKKMTEHYSII